MADGLMLQITLSNTAELVASRKADYETQRARRLALEAQLKAEEAEQAKLNLQLAEQEERCTSARLAALKAQRAIAKLRVDLEGEAAPVAGLTQELRAADERLAALRALSGAERAEAESFAGSMDAWVDGLGAPARDIAGDIEEMEARTRALEQQHEQERLAERPQELAQRLAGLAARRSDLAASLGAARAANERARAEAAAAAAAANKEAEEVEEARAQGQEQVFEAGRQQKVNGTKLKQLRRDLEQLKDQKRHMGEALAKASAAAAAAAAAASAAAAAGCGGGGGGGGGFSGAQQLPNAGAYGWRPHAGGPPRG